MSIMSDRWINDQCRPKEVFVRRDHLGKLYQVYGLNGISDMDRFNATSDDPVRIATAEECRESLGMFGPMIEPFSSKQVRYSDAEEKNRVISYGTSSYGYDIRCAPEFKVFTNVHSAIVDPKNFSPDAFVDMVGDSCVIPPNSFALARSVEYMRIPRDVLVVCLGKSTYARCGIIVNVTPLEPEWEGHITLEFSNTTTLPARIYANEGCAQLLFFKGERPCDLSYKDRGGKYQGQLGVTLPRG